MYINVYIACTNTIHVSLIRTKRPMLSVQSKSEKRLRHVIVQLGVCTTGCTDTCVRSHIHLLIVQICRTFCIDTVVCTSTFHGLSRRLCV